jgi:hypothetical protein
MSYLQVLSRHDVAHVYNHWSSMPPLAEQHAKMQGFTAVFTVLKLPHAVEDVLRGCQEASDPYTKIVEKLPQMRTETVQLVRQAVSSEGRRACVLVNNRSEGNAPLTVQSLSEMLHT